MNLGCVKFTNSSVIFDENGDILRYTVFMDTTFLNIKSHIKGHIYQIYVSEQSHEFCEYKNRWWCELLHDHVTEPPFPTEQAIIHNTCLNTPK
jgi:hypothetical protein